ncbi:MAG: tetratricopeptide repeat protein [Gemmatimonadaceae bacterium]|nr:tetratricopeptide repeat protein [Gemmatimonadaceae bacterium]
MMTHLWLSEAFPVDGTPLFRRSFSYADDARELVARAQAYERRGAAREATVAYDMVLALIDGAPAGPFHADVLRWKGTLLRELGFTTRADALYRRSLAIAQNIGYTLGIAHAQHCLATIHQRRGQLPQATELYRDATANALAAGDQRLATMIGQNLAVLATILGDVDGAWERYRASLGAFRAAGDDEGTIWTLYHLGVLATHTDHAAEAEAAFDEGLALARTRGDVFLEGLLVLGRAELLIRTGRLEDGENECERALVVADQRGDRLRRAEALRLRAMIDQQRCDLDRATRSLTEAEELALEGEDARLVADVLREAGQVWLRRGDIGHARATWEQAMSIFRTIGATPDIRDLERRLSTLAH